jgi:hypothetical protein
VYAVYAKSKKRFLSMKWMFVTRKHLAEKLNMVLRKCVVTAGIGRRKIQRVIKCIRKCCETLYEKSMYGAGSC